MEKKGIKKAWQKIKWNLIWSETIDVNKMKSHQIVASGEVIIGESTGKCHDCTGRESGSAKTRFGLGSECDGKCNRSWFSESAEEGGSHSGLDLWEGQRERNGCYEAERVLEASERRRRRRRQTWGERVNSTLRRCVRKKSGITWTNRNHYFIHH